MAVVPAVNILLVDDHPENLVALEAILGELGQNLVRAASGPEALKRLLKQEFALILLDVQMPGMDGFQTARLIRERERSRHTPILFLTAHDQGETPVARGYAAGAVDYIFKPVVPEILKAKVATFVELEQKTQELRGAVAQRERAEQALRELNRDLERRVAERTAELAAESQERKQLEEELRQRVEDLAASAHQKDAFLAMLAHELRNPLGALSNALQVMKRARPGTPAFTRAQESAIRQVEHQTRLVEDLLDVSRITRGRLALRKERLDLARLVRETVDDYRGRLDQAGLSLTLELPDGPVAVTGDRVRLAQVLSNLLDNAAKFTPPGGHVTISLRLDEGYRVQGTGFSEGHGRVHRDDLSTSEPERPSLPEPYTLTPVPWAVLAVRDTGVGIEPHMLPDLFDTFTQAEQSLDRSRGGLGLGLALVKGLVELHGGSVRAHSEGPGCGAAFTLLLPVATEPKVLQETPHLSPGLSANLRILIVEDNRDAAETLRDLLELFGYEVELAHSGPQGVEVARRFHPEVVLCDIGLPGMDGYQVASALRRDPTTAAAHLIAVTGYGGEDDRRRSEAVGFEEHLTKPVDPEALQQLLASVAPP